MLVYRRQFYMPPFHMITKDHLKDVLQEKKAFLKISEVRFCNAPAFEEIGVKALYERVIKLPNMAQYFGKHGPFWQAPARGTPLDGSAMIRNLITPILSLISHS